MTVPMRHVASMVQVQRKRVRLHVDEIPHAMIRRNIILTENRPICYS